jgi:hypothetical protein
VKDANNQWSAVLIRPFLKESLTPPLPQQLQPLNISLMLTQAMVQPSSTCQGDSHHQ